MKVCDAMTPDVQLCTPEGTLEDAAEAMMALNVGLLPVTDSGAPAERLDCNAF
jgi:CBS domain-containing protein